MYRCFVQGTQVSRPYPTRQFNFSYGNGQQSGGRPAENLFPRFKYLFRMRVWNQTVLRPYFKLRSPCQVKPYLQVGLGFARRVHCFVRWMHSPISVSEAFSLLSLLREQPGEPHSKEM